MNRRQKIIVSVTGIFLVLLLLVGLTYAYFLTKINGNENTKSISVSTANLALVYGDGNGIITGAKIQPGTTLDTKTFTVKNEGNATTDYVVVIEDVSVTYAETIEVDGVTQTAGETTTFKSNDFIYTLTCESDGVACDGINYETQFPINGNKTVLVGNSIEVGKTHTYSLTVTYKETGINQSADMNKSLEAKVNIMDIKAINPYSSDTTSLAYNIINNAITNKNGTILVNTPPTKVAEEESSSNLSNGTVQNVPEIPDGLPINISDIRVFGDSDSVTKCEFENECDENVVIGAPNSCSEIIGKTYINNMGWIGTASGCDDDTGYLTTTIKAETNISVTQDEYGTSYYYRGNVEDNYVKFAGMLWRIVRISGDGSIKLILEDEDLTDNVFNDTKGYGNFGYTYTESHYIFDYLNGETNSDKSMATAFKNFETTLKTNLGINNLSTVLKSGDWCIADKAYTRSETGEKYTYTLISDAEAKANKENGIEFFYDSYVRLNGDSVDGYNPTLTCTGTNMKYWDEEKTKPMYVGTLTADEIAFAGDIFDLGLSYNYLWNLKHQACSWGTLSPSIHSGSDYNFYYMESCASTPGLIYDSSASNNSFRPAISLASGVKIASGDGSISNPYTIQ